MPSEELPRIGAEWLAEGLDSPSLRELAGTSSPQMSDVGPLFEKVLSELHFVLPKKEEALSLLARHYAQQIIDGVVSPYDGARKIWWQVSNELERSDPLLLSFVGAASEIEELPERTEQDGCDRQKYARELEEMIVASARQLLKEVPNKPTRSNSP